jgi:ribonuclease D
MPQQPTITFHRQDLPNDFPLEADVAVDTETMGLNHHRDRLCLVSISDGSGTAHLVEIARGQNSAPNLKRVLENPATTKLFHFARFDVVTLKKHLNIDCDPIYCTKIASKLARTFSDKHGLQTLCRDLLGIEISKDQQSSDWGSGVLSDDQKRYAASDVLYLHQLRERLDQMLLREGRDELAQRCFAFLPTRAALDMDGWTDKEPDVFSH